MSKATTKKLKTRPFLSPELTPLVEFVFGRESGKLTTDQAEDLAECLTRAATTARYESAVAEYLRDHQVATGHVKATLTGIRAKMKDRKIARN